MGLNPLKCRSKCNLGLLQPKQVLQLLNKRVANLLLLGPHSLSKECWLHIFGRNKVGNKLQKRVQGCEVARGAQVPEGGRIYCAPLSTQHLLWASLGVPLLSVLAVADPILRPYIGSLGTSFRAEDSAPKYQVNITAHRFLYGSRPNCLLFHNQKSC